MVYKMVSLINNAYSSLSGFLLGAQPLESKKSQLGSNIETPSPSLAQRGVSFGKNLLKGDFHTTCALLAIAGAAKYVILQPSWAASGFAAVQVAAATPFVATYGAIALTLIAGLAIAHYTLNKGGQAPSQSAEMAAAGLGLCAGQGLINAGQKRTEESVTALGVSPQTNKIARGALSSLAIGASSYISYQLISRNTGNMPASRHIVMATGIGLGAYRAYTIFNEPLQEKSGHLQSSEGLSRTKAVSIGGVATGTALETAGLVVTTLAVCVMIRSAKLGLFS